MQTYGSSVVPMIEANYEMFTVVEKTIAGIAIFIYFEFRPKLLVFLFQLRNSLQCTFQ